MRYDSDDFQFRGSERYRLGLPLEPAESEEQALFSRTQILEWRRRAKEFNREERGDLATFYLKK